MKKETLKILLNQLRENQIILLKHKFEEVDKDKNGTISADEIQELMGQLGYNNTQKEINELIEKITSKSMCGKTSQISIKYSEFMAALLNRKSYLNQERLWFLFKYFDNENKNYLNITDLKITFEREGRLLSDQKLQTLFREIDENKDGRVEFEDFCKLMHEDALDEQFIESQEKRIEQQIIKKNSLIRPQIIQSHDSEMKQSKSQKLVSPKGDEWNGIEKV